MNSASRQLSGTEDGSHIFEAIGLIIGLEDVPAEKQSDYLSLLLTPLCQQVLVPTILLFALGIVYVPMCSDSFQWECTRLRKDSWRQKLQMVKSSL